MNYNKMLGKRACSVIGCYAYVFGKIESIIHIGDKTAVYIRHDNQELEIEPVEKVIILDTDTK